MERREIRRLRGPRQFELNEPHPCIVLDGDVARFAGASSGKNGDPPESKAPSTLFHVSETTQKKASGSAPYPNFVEVLTALPLESPENRKGLGANLKRRLNLALLKLFLFRRVHGTDGLKRRIARKLSIPYVCRTRAIRRKQRHFYLESVQGGRVFGEPPPPRWQAGRSVSDARLLTLKCRIFGAVRVPDPRNGETDVGAAHLAPAFFFPASWPRPDDASLHCGSS